MGVDTVESSSPLTPARNSHLSPEIRWSSSCGDLTEKADAGPSVVCSLLMCWRWRCHHIFFWESTFIWMKHCKDYVLWFLQCFGPDPASSAVWEAPEKRRWMLPQLPGLLTTWQNTACGIERLCVCKNSQNQRSSSVYYTLRFLLLFTSLTFKCSLYPDHSGKYLNGQYWMYTALSVGHFCTWLRDYLVFLFFIFAKCVC